MFGKSTNSFHMTQANEIIGLGSVQLGIPDSRSSFLGFLSFQSAFDSFSQLRRVGHLICSDCEDLDRT